MTTQEQDAVAGRLIRERQELERKIAVITAEARRIGEFLSELGRQTIHLKVALESEEVPDEFDRHTDPLYRITQTRLDEINKVVTLAQEYRTAVQGLRERSQQLKAIGIEAR